MKKLTDEELDSIFKNASEALQPAFDSTGWDSLNVKLDQPKPTVWKRWMSFVFLGIVIFSTGVWVGMRLNQRGMPTRTQSVVKAEDRDFSKKRQTFIQENLDQAQTSSNKIVKDNDLVLNHQINGIARLNLSDRPDSNQEIDSKGKSLDVTNDHDFLTDESNDFVVISKDFENDLEVSVIQDDSSLVKPEINELIAEEIAKKNIKKEHALFLRALASPDFTSINYTSTSETGSNYSIAVEYQLSDHWSISSGAIWAMKKYSSDNKVTYGKYTADRMIGDCRILDIPITLYHYFPSLSKTSFYLGAGLSSYIMLEEDYTYTVDYPSGSRDYSYYIEKKNNDWFKMLNLSVGMQYRLVPRFHLQVEPFLKAPLAGVGEWDVRLSSIGIFLGAKYKIN